MSTTGIYLNGRELSAMAGLPHVQIVLYMTMRRFMDYTTGIVGIRRGVSWQMLREYLYVDPAPGIRGESPSKDQIRRAAASLERAGLIVISGKNGESFRLVFKCVLATTDKSVKNKAAIGSPLLAAIPEAAPLLDSKHDAATPEPHKAATPPSVRDISIPPPPMQDIEVGGVGVVEFHRIIKPESRPVITKYLEAANPDDRQPLVDDLAGWLSAQSGKGLPVANQAGVMRRMMERYANGEWAPEQAHIGKALRQRDREKASAGKPPEERRCSQPPDSFKAALAMLRVKS